MTGACRTAFGIVVASTVLLLTTACVHYRADPETPGPGTTSSGQSDVAPGSTTPGATPRAAASSRRAASYAFSLPGGPSNAANQEDRVYEWLRKGECDSGQRQLDADWSGMSSPSFVLIFQAAVEACKDQRTAARRWYDRMRRMFPDTYNHCSNMWTVHNAYRALVSYLTNVPASSVATADYPIAFWPTTPDGDTDYDHDPRQNDFPTAQPRTPATDSTTQATGPTAQATDPTAQPTTAGP